MRPHSCSLTLLSQLLRSFLDKSGKRKRSSSRLIQEDRRRLCSQGTAALKHLQTCQASVVGFHPSACVGHGHVWSTSHEQEKSWLPVCVHPRNSDNYIIVHVQQFTLFVYTNVHPFIKVINNNFLCIFQLSHSGTTADLYHMTVLQVQIHDPLRSSIFWKLFDDQFMHQITCSGFFVRSIQLNF